MTPPITSIGLRLSDEKIRISVAFKLGFRTCELHTCPCGNELNARDQHGLSCRRSSARQQQHAELNDIIWRSIKRAQIPVSKETSRFVTNGLETSSLSHTRPMVMWQTTGLGCNRPGHVRRFTPEMHSCYRWCRLNRSAELKYTK